MRFAIALWIGLCAVAAVPQPSHAANDMQECLSLDEGTALPACTRVIADKAAKVEFRASAYALRGSIRERQGDTLGALEDFNAALKLNPQDVQAKDGRIRLTLGSDPAPVETNDLAAVETPNVEKPTSEDLKTEPDATATLDSSPIEQKDAPKQADSASLARRVALVIGNSAYQRVAQLKNPSRDAEAVAQGLRDIGFADVTVVEDLDLAGFNKALREFSQKADGADWAVIYYAGHGMTIDNSNWLVPVDAALASDRDVAFEAVPMERLETATEGASGMRMIILDACRENPFAVSMQRKGATRSIGRGLARVQPKARSVVIFSASEGQVAADGDGQNSPFVEALLKRMSEPGLEIGKFVRLLTADVEKATGNRQSPWVESSLPPDDIYFNPPR